MCKQLNADHSKRASFFSGTFVDEFGQKTYQHVGLLARTDSLGPFHLFGPSCQGNILLLVGKLKLCHFCFSNLLQLQQHPLSVCLQLPLQAGKYGTKKWNLWCQAASTLLRQSRIFLGLSRYLWTIRMLKSCDSTTRPLQKSQDDWEDESSTVGRVASGYKSASFRLAGGKRCFGAPTALANQVFSIFMAGGVGKQLLHHKSNVLWVS